MVTEGPGGILGAECKSQRTLGQGRGVGLSMCVTALPCESGVSCSRRPSTLRPFLTFRSSVFEPEDAQLFRESASH